MSLLSPRINETFFIFFISLIHLKTISGSTLKLFIRKVLSVAVNCFIMIIFVLINAITGRDFGPMRKAEERAVISGQLFAEDAVLMTSQDLSNLNRQATTHISSLSAIIPLFSLFITIFIAFWVFSDSQN